MENPNPTPLGLQKSFGFGDRLGLAGAGHIAALERSSFAGVLAQQSIREMTRTARTPEEVMEAARGAIAAAKYRRPWGADADHLKTREDVAATTAAGFCFFTIDPSESVADEADGMGVRDLRKAVAAQEADGLYNGSGPAALYGGKTFEIDGAEAITLEEKPLLRAAVKYGRAIAHCEAMAGFIAEENPGRPYEVEVSVDETASPTSPAEHLFFALELKRRGIQVVSLAPRFIGDFEKGVDYRGDTAAFEASLAVHVAIARTCGPYKISVHSGSDKFAVYPAIGRVCGDLLHVKTAGTSYLEALRVACRQDAALFGEIVGYCTGRFAEDVHSYHVSTTQKDVDALAADASTGRERERVFLDGDAGRQLLHVTFGSVLSQGVRENGQTFKAALLECLEKHADLHTELVAEHLGKHLKLLEAG